MRNTTITIHFGGTLPINLFAQAVARYEKLVTALSKEVGGKTDVSWIVERLEAGSATATFRGHAPDLEPVERIVEAYAVVGRALETGSTVPYGAQVVKHATNLLSLMNGNITSIRFETEESIYEVSTALAEGTRHHFTIAFGEVEGKIETLQYRRLSFTLYDSLDDRAVLCRSNEELQELLREMWGRRAIVAGQVKRDAETGRPIEVLNIEQIRPLPEIAPGSWRVARGIMSRGGNEPSAATRIRNLRDAN